MDKARRLFLRSIALAIASSLAFLAGLPLLTRFIPERRGGEEIQRRCQQRINLPMPRLRGSVSVEEALANRRSIRRYRAGPLALEELGQILWAAQGVNETRYGLRTAPSAGATYPLKVYVVASPRGIRYNDRYLDPGSYLYTPESHELVLVKRGDLVTQLYRAALEQDWVLQAPANIVITAIYERTTRRYGVRGIRYVYMEAGHVGQNIYLQATALGLATVAVGAFIDDAVREIVGAEEDEHPLYIMPLARPKTPYRLRRELLVAYIESHRARE